MLNANSPPGRRSARDLGHGAVRVAEAHRAVIAEHDVERRVAATVPRSRSRSTSSHRDARRPRPSSPRGVSCPRDWSSPVTVRADARELDRPLRGAAAVLEHVEIRRRRRARSSSASGRSQTPQPIVVDVELRLVLGLVVVGVLVPEAPVEPLRVLPDPDVVLLASCRGSRSGAGRSRGRCRSGRGRRRRRRPCTRRARGSSTSSATARLEPGQGRAEAVVDARGRTRGGRPGCGRCRSGRARPSGARRGSPSRTAAGPCVPAGSVTPCSSTSRVSSAGERLGRRVEAQRLFDRGRDERRVGEQLGALVGERVRARRSRCRCSFVVVSFPAISSRKQKPSTSLGESDRSPSSAATSAPTRSSLGCSAARRRSRR